MKTDKGWLYRVMQSVKKEMKTPLGKVFSAYERRKPDDPR